MFPARAAQTVACETQVTAGCDRSHPASGQPEHARIAGLLIGPMVTAAAGRSIPPPPRRVVRGSNYGSRCPRSGPACWLSLSAYPRDPSTDIGEEVTPVARLHLGSPPIVARKAPAARR